MIRLAILGSTRGTNLQPLIDAIDSGRLKASIELVVSNKEEAMILTRARNAGLKAIYVPVNGLTRRDYDAKLSELLKANEVDLIVLVGYMRILSASFVSTWANQIINIHPSLLPAFGGLMDLAVHQAVIDSKVEETGCTVHYVTEELDAGPILIQKTCLVQAGDSAEVLKARVQALESEALIEAIACIEEGLL